jgi:hypothetical protein
MGTTIVRAIPGLAEDHVPEPGMVGQPKENPPRLLLLVAFFGCLVWLMKRSYHGESRTCQDSAARGECVEQVEEEPSVHISRP